jgi:hypothetical protein
LIDNNERRWAEEPLLVYVGKTDLSSKRDCEVAMMRSVSENLMSGKGLEMHPACQVWQNNTQLGEVGLPLGFDKL